MKISLPLCLVVLASLFIGAQATVTPAAGPLTRPKMVAAMATNCIVRGLDELAAGSTNLSRATQHLLEHPGTNSLAAARRAWVEMQMTWKRNQMLAHGPVNDPAFWTFIFYPQAFPTAVENVVRSPRPLNADFIEVLGASARGFYVIEYLLFESAPKADGTNSVSSLKLLQSGPAAERRRLYLRLLAQDFEARLQSADAEARKPSFAPGFVNGGTDSVNLLVNQIVDGVETGVLKPLDACLAVSTNATARFTGPGGTASGTTLPGMKAALEGVRSLYHGGGGTGIADYVQQVNPGLAARMDAQFKKTEAALDTLKTSPGDSVPRDQTLLNQASEEARKLEQLCKVDLISALGATVLFNANDGD